MRVFDINKSINENLKFEIQLATRAAEHAIFAFNRLSIFEKINTRFHLFNESLEKKREEIIKTYIDDLTYCFERKFVREGVALNCINICKYQLHTCLNNCGVEGGVIGKMLILSSGDIPDLQEVTYSCDDFEVGLLTHDFLFDLLKEDAFDVNNPVEDEYAFLAALISYYDHFTRQLLFEALETIEKKGILSKVPNKTPIIFNFGEPNHYMYTIYYFENKHHSLQR